MILYLLIIFMLLVLSQAYKLSYFANKYRAKHIFLVNDNKFDAYFEELSGKEVVSLIERNYPIEAIANYLKEGYLNLEPEYQRGFVWSGARSARLIETILNRRFIPPVVWHEKEDGNFDVIDGKQRLSTILSFYLGKRGYDAYHLPLSACELKPDSTDDDDKHPLDGLTFDAMPEKHKRSFRNYAILVKTVPKSADPDLVFDIYEDINSGADDLTTQQLRRAAFNGPYISMVHDLRNNTELLIIRDKKETDAKEADGEMVLRAFAYSNINYEEYKVGLKKFLNRHANKYKDKSIDEVIQYKKEFEMIVIIMVNIFGPEAVCREWDRATQQWKKNVALWLWDALYTSIKNLMIEDDKVYNRVTFQRHADAIKHRFQQAFGDGRFETIKGPSKSNLIKRVDLVKALLRQPIDSSNQLADKRLFSRSDDLIGQLWERQEGVCPLCDNIIQESRRNDVHYTEIDHIHPVSLGGRTVDSNAQLVHSLCNRSKGNRPPPPLPVQSPQTELTPFSWIESIVNEELA